MKKILVTGGAGYIGSHLCESLSKDTSNTITINKESKQIQIQTYIQNQ